MRVHVSSSNASLTPIPVSSDGPVRITVHAHDTPGSDISVEPLSVTANGTYTAPEEKAYSPVTVNVPQTTVESLSVTENDTYTAPDGKAYSPVTVNVPQTTIESKSITENGTYTAPSGKAYTPITVNVPQSTVTVQSLTATENGTYTAPSGNAYSPVTVNVSTPTPVTVPRRDVNFYDYDGTIVASYSAADFANLSALPANPSHDRLTAQGWNWTLSDAQSYVATYGKLEIGQMYASSSGKTEFDITLTGADLSPTLVLTINGTVVIEWGDGNSDTVTQTGQYATTTYNPHTYSAAGDYRVSVTVSSGTCALSKTGNANFPGIFCANTSYNGVYSYSQKYSGVLKEVRIGTGMQIGSYAFTNNSSLTGIPLPRGALSGSVLSNSLNPSFYWTSGIKHITIPDDVTFISSDMFGNCWLLESVSLPKSVVDTQQGAFLGCSALERITLPPDMEYIGSAGYSSSYNMFRACPSLRTVVLPSGFNILDGYAFYNCYNLQDIHLPSGLRTIGTYAFYNCWALRSIDIPAGVTSIPDYAFSNCHSLESVTIPNGVTSIGAQAFKYDYCLGSVTFPSSLTSIGDEAFNDVTGIQNVEYHIQATTPPTLGTNVFSSSMFMSYGAKIYVPTASVDAYKEAATWVNYKWYIYGE